MQRIINNPDMVVEDMLKGFVKAHEDIVSATENPRVLKYRNAPVKDKVGIVTGGGSGHKPAFIGYIGKNLCDAVAVGEIFSSPTAVAFYNAFREADSKKGVACLYGNYAGDNMNVKMAIQMAEDNNITVKCVAANDDVASSPKDRKEKRHGIAGGFFMWKVGGAKAALGGSLDEIIQTAQKAVDNTRSICVGLSPCTIPAVGKSNFEIAPDTMEFGIGHHGEPGIRIEKLKSADEIAEEMTNTLLNDFSFEKKEDLAVMISGLGSTPMMELYVLYNKVEEILNKEGHNIYKVYIGNYVTSLDMNGVSLTLMNMDDELKDLLEYPASPVGMKNY